MAAFETEEEKKCREQSCLTGTYNLIFRLSNILFVAAAVCNAPARDLIAWPCGGAGEKCVASLGGERVRPMLSVLERGTPDS